MIREPVRQRRRRRPLWIALTALGAAAVFAAGIALGMALHDNPRPGPLVTVERTVELPATTAH